VGELELISATNWGMLLVGTLNLCSLTELLVSAKRFTVKTDLEMTYNEFSGTLKLCALPQLIFVLDCYSQMYVFVHHCCDDGTLSHH